MADPRKPTRHGREQPAPATPVRHGREPAPPGPVVAPKPDAGQPGGPLVVRVECSPSPRFSRVEVALTYEDPASGLFESRTVGFEAGDPKPQSQEWRVALADPTRRSYRWCVRGFTRAGEVVTGPWNVGSAPVLVVDAALLAKLGA